MPLGETAGEAADRGDRSSAEAGSTSRHPAAAEAWRAEAADLAREVQAVADTGDKLVTDPERLAKQLVPLSATLKGHAREAPAEVESEAVEALFALGADCYEIGMEHSRSTEARTGVLLEERLANLAERAATLEATLTSA